MEKESTSKKNSPNVGFGVSPLPSAKHKWHIDNALDAKIAADVVHNGERGFHIHISWLYSSSISQSYRGFTDFGGICSGIPRLNTASVMVVSAARIFQYHQQQATRCGSTRVLSKMSGTLR
jgi:hypothetical protein